MKTSTKVALGIIAYIAYVMFGCYFVHGGDTYDCINATGDYINYGPAAPAADPTWVLQHIVIAHDSARSEPRWQAMLDPNDYRNLEYIRAYNSGNSGIIVYGQ